MSSFQTRVPIAFAYFFPAAGVAFLVCVVSEPPSASLIQSISSTNFLLNLPRRPVTSLSSAAPSPVREETFHSGWFVTSRVRRIKGRGEVVQCVKLDPSARMTRCGNWGTTGLGSLFGRRFQTWVRPYGEDETRRAQRGAV